VRCPQGPGSGGGASRDKATATGPSRADANDYSQHFVDTGWRPQNFLRDAHMVGDDSTVLLVVQGIGFRAICMVY